MSARREAEDSYGAAIDQLISVVHRCHLICFFCMGKDGVFFKLSVQLNLCINNAMFAGIFFFKMHVTCLFKK